jgi:hypothetical protein
MATSSSFAIELDKAALAEVKVALAGVENGASRVLSRAINKTLDGVRTDSVNEIAKDITPKKSVIRGTFTVKKTTVSNLEGRTSSKGKPLGLIHYQARKTKKGVSVKVKRNGKRSVIPGSFIAKAKGAENVFWRQYKGPRGKVRPGFQYGVLPKYPYRLPIERLTGPRVPDIMDKPEVMAAILAAADIRLDKNLSNQIDYELSRL